MALFNGGYIPATALLDVENYYVIYTHSIAYHRVVDRQANITISIINIVNIILNTFIE